MRPHMMSVVALNGRRVEIIGYMVRGDVIDVTFYEDGCTVTLTVPRALALLDRPSNN